MGGYIQYCSLDKKFIEYTAYRTNRQALPCVKYWDKVFRKTELFYDWQVTYATVEYHITMLRKELNISKREARKLVWGAYCDAVRGHLDSPFFEEYDQFCDAVTESLIPFFGLVKCIGVDIHGGYTQRQAEQEFKKWLLEDPKNGVFGNYQIMADLSIERVRHG